MNCGNAKLKKCIKQNIIGTSEAADLLGCTPQNVRSLANRGLLEPVAVLKQGMLFLRSDIEARREEYPPGNWQMKRVDRWEIEARKNQPK